MLWVTPAWARRKSAVAVPSWPGDRVNSNGPSSSPACGAAEMAAAESSPRARLMWAGFHPSVCMANSATATAVACRLTPSIRRVLMPRALIWARTGGGHGDRRQRDQSDDGGSHRHEDSELSASQPGQDPSSWVRAPDQRPRVAPPSTVITDPDM